MNTKFTLKNLDVTVAETPIKIGEVTIEVTDYNLLEGLKFAKEIPAIMKELKEIMEEESILDVHSERISNVMTQVHGIKNDVQEMKQIVGRAVTKLERMQGTPASNFGAPSQFGAPKFAGSNVPDTESDNQSAFSGMAIERELARK